MLAALAKATRMTAFRWLVSAYPESIGAGDIARECKVPQDTMSAQSGAALATVVGVLIEVPVMLTVVWVVNRSKGWYEGEVATFKAENPR